MRSRTLIGGLALLAATSAGQNASVVSDLPRADFVGPGPRPPVRPPLARTHDLFRVFVEGGGALTGAAPGVRAERGALLPWRVAAGREEAAVHQVWDGPGDSQQQGVNLLRLGSGQRWCTPEIAAEPGARLRFEAFALDAANGRVVVTHGPRAETKEIPELPRGSEGRPVDLELSGTGPICFAAANGEVGIAEPRVLAPEAPGADPRPRWIVLTISDSLRADAWRGHLFAGAAPRTAELAAAARSYDDARTPGSHTTAALWPLFTGRDLMRVAPRMRQNPQWSRLELLDPPRVFSHPNLFVSQYAEAAGYRAAFFGNNTWPGRMLVGFSRFAVQGSSATGTVDGVRALAPFLARYADERLLLVHWSSAAHLGSAVPRRLYDELGCATRSGREQELCVYQAHVRHNDEAVGALLDGLDYFGVRDRSLVILTADHGEAFADGWGVEGLRDGVWRRLDHGHGYTNGPPEVQVPLVVAGPGIAPARWADPVSTLDIVPTLLATMRIAPAGRLDGQVLPLFPGGARTGGRERRFVTYGFCGHTDAVVDRQLVWWDESACPIRRRVGETAERHDPFELMQRGAFVDHPPAGVVEALRGSHAAWLTDRMPGEMVMLDTAALAPGSTLVLKTPHGRVVDYGPSSTGWGLETLGPVTLSLDEREVTVALGAYRGLYSIATRPPRTEVEIRVTGGADPTVFVGPHQLPLEVLGRPFDPATRADYTVSPREPGPQAAKAPFLRVWWQPYDAVDTRDRSAAMEEFNRVLREWGYIR
jgi:hypothetical protein